MVPRLYIDELINARNIEVDLMNANMEPLPFRAFTDDPNVR